MPRGKEWFCGHGIGHYVDGSIHGCDGCCTREPTGAERYLAERLKDDEYRSAYETARQRLQPRRVIEKVCYGPHTPDSLGDVVPQWGDTDRGMPTAQEWWDLEGRVARVGGDIGEHLAFAASTELEARWLAACCVAHNAGCPPHWVDMGFKPSTLHGWPDWESTKPCIVAFFDPDVNRWVLPVVPVSVVEFATEMEARFEALRIINNTKEPT